MGFYSDESTFKVKHMTMKSTVGKGQLSCTTTLSKTGPEVVALAWPCLEADEKSITKENWGLYEKSGSGMKLRVGLKIY